jgi:hypothetical protein
MDVCYLTMGGGALPCCFGGLKRRFWRFPRDGAHTCTPAAAAARAHSMAWRALGVKRVQGWEIASAGAFQPLPRALHTRSRTRVAARVGHALPSRADVRRNARPRSCLRSCARRRRCMR